MAKYCLCWPLQGCKHRHSTGLEASTLLYCEGNYFRQTSGSDERLHRIYNVYGGWSVWRHFWCVSELTPGYEIHLGSLKARDGDGLQAFCTGVELSRVALVAALLLELCAFVSPAALEGAWGD